MRDPALKHKDGGYQRAIKWIQSRTGLRLVNIREDPRIAIRNNRIFFRSNFPRSIKHSNKNEY